MIPSAMAIKYPQRTSQCAGVWETSNKRNEGLTLEVLEIVAILLAGETGAVFVDAFEFTVAFDLSIGVIGLQGAEQGNEGCTLFWRPGIVSTAFLVIAALITDADGMGIVVSGMNTHLVLITGLIELTVTLNVVVIADALVMEPGVVTGFQHLDRETLVTARCRTMDNDKIDLSFHLPEVRGYTIGARNSVRPGFPEQL